MDELKYLVFFVCFFASEGRMDCKMDKWTGAATTVQRTPSVHWVEKEAELQCEAV